MDTIKVKSSIYPAKNMADGTRFWIGSDHTNVQRLWVREGWKSECMKRIEIMNAHLDKLDSEFLSQPKEKKAALVLVKKGGAA